MTLGLGIILITSINTISLFILSKTSTLSQTSLLLLLGQITSLLGITLLSWSFFLSSRLKIIENIFGGLDKSYKYHQITSVLAFILLINHPLLLMINSLPSPSAFSLFFIPGTNLAYTLGIISLYLMIFIIVITAYFRLPYHLWKSLHEYSGLIMFFGGLHAFLITSDVSRYVPLRIWIIGLILLALLAFVYVRLLYRFLGPVYKYTVSDISRQGDFMEISLTPLRKHMSYSSGQFAFVKFPNLDQDDPHSHPFSLTSSPQDSQLRFSIKILGDHTLKLTGLKTGQPALVSGPHGHFFDLLPVTSHAVFIAGGIGITPFLSILNTPPSETSRISLIHSVSHEQNSTHHDLLTKLSITHNFNYRLHSTISQGRLTAQGILDILSSDPNQMRFFLCGPTPMMRSLADQLIGSGIRPSRIIYEDFSFV